MASFRGKYKRYHCFRCLSAFKTEEKCSSHNENCSYGDVQRIELPSAGSQVKYKNYNKELKHPYVIYADFETLSVKNTTSSSVIATLPVCSYGYVAVDWNGKVVHSDFARGEKMGQAFLESIIECAKKLNESLTAARKPLQMTPMDENAFKKAKDCHICGEGLTNKDKVRDHDHLTGVFRGAAHYQCNFAYSLPTVIPVMFHNLKTLTVTLSSMLSTKILVKVSTSYPIQ